MPQHSDDVPVFTEGSKAADSIGFEIAFPCCECKGRLTGSNSVLIIDCLEILKLLKKFY